MNISSSKPYTRKERVTSHLQPVIAEFVRSEANTFPLITITNVDISADLKNALVFFTAIPEDREQDAKIFLMRKAKDMRAYIKNHARLKTIPNLSFEFDRSEQHRRNIDELERELS